MRLMRSAVLGSALLTLALASPVGASSPNPQWTVARSMLLPTGATGLTQGYLPGLACPSAGNCTAAGAFDDLSGNTQGLLITETSGTWNAPYQVVPPSDAGTNPAVTIYAVSCPSVGSCGAVGSYQDVRGDTQSFVVNESASSWANARKVTLPTDALLNGQNSNVRAVSCTSPGNCSAVGSYLDGTSPISRQEGFTLNEVNGTWKAASTVQLPPRANFNPFVSISQIQCTASANCVAIGSYVDAQNTTRALVLSEVNGVWAAAKALVLPNNANAYPLASLSEVTCVSAGNCVAIGTYLNSTGATQGMTASESSGVWGRATAMAMPVNAAANPHVFFYGYAGVSCSSIGNCSAGGQYRDRSGHYQGFFVNEVAGNWQAATEMAIPPGALEAGRNGGVVAVSCSSDGNCSAGAAYLDAAGNYQALVVNRVNSLWQTGVMVVLPAGATNVGTGGGIYGLVCGATGPCTATGSYLDAQGNYQGMTLSSS